MAHATPNLQGRKIAFLATDGVEQIELTAPWRAVEGAGGQPVLLSVDTGPVRGFNHLDPADRFDVDLVVKDANFDDYVALVLPGGVANPDALRMDDAAVSFVRRFAVEGKPIGVICHGPWTLVEADVVRGRDIASWPSVPTDLRNAGAAWHDEAVVVDRNGPGVIVSSRKPDDLSAFCSAILAEFSRLPVAQPA